MTLIVAMEGKDHVVVGADSRGLIKDIAGNRIQMNIEEKLIPLTKHVCILVAGEADIARQLIEEFKDNVISKVKKINNVSKIAKLFSKFCKKEFKEIIDFIPATSQQFPDVDFIIAGLQKEKKKFKPRLYLIRSWRAFYPERSRNFAIDGKNIVAYYLFAKKYRDDMTVDEECTLVSQSIYDTIQIDGDVGGKVSLAVINSHGFSNIESDVYIEEWGVERFRRIIED
jgi:20S proteasome alpha/beta subunit